MSRVVAVALCLTALAPLSQLRAQRRELTLLAGSTLSGASGDHLDQLTKQAGFAAGLSLRLPRSPQFSLQTELLIVQHRLRGQRPSGNAPPLAVGPFADAANLWFVNIPVLLRFQRGYSSRRPIRPYLIAGGYLAVRLACRHQVTESNGTAHDTDCAAGPSVVTFGSETYIPAVYEEVNVGLTAGAGVELKRLALGARFAQSLRPMVQPGGGVRTSPFDNAKPWTALFSVEYLIRVL